MKKCPVSVVFFCTICLGGAWLWSGVTKMLSPAEFREIVAAHEVLSGSLKVAAASLGLIEAGIGFAIVAAGGGGSADLCVIAIVVASRSGQRLSCVCASGGAEFRGVWMWFGSIERRWLLMVLDKLGC
jgi:hypothetical protein